MKVIAERRKLLRRPAGAGVERGMVTEYNAEELADVSKDDKRLEKAKQFAERHAAKRKKMHNKPGAIHRETHSLSNSARGSTASSGMQTGYQVLRRPGMLRCCCDCNPIVCSVCFLCS